MAAGWVVVLLAIAATDAAAEVDFARDVQPILAGRCLKCHGADVAEAGLRLTDRAAATAALESGSRAILPGRPEDSNLLRRVTAADADERMPPEGPPLSADQVEVLRRWITEGADWPRHWAYRPLTRPPVPVEKLDRGHRSRVIPAHDPDDGWPRTPIDSFVLRKLVAYNLGPSPPADQRTLLRRVYFDLVGLPPTPEEVEAFLADDGAAAYERVVDRLLSSPRYGERWARHWMDVVHYAETHGHDQDRPREHAWPYRDYLIRSFNDDKPYARFVQEQIAGDVLFPGDEQALIATGLLATGPWDESSLRDIREDTLDREVARYLDRDDIVTTVMSTFVSSTVHCARCHDHKFDPITQREYYALQAVFAATDKANREYDVDPQVAKRREELTVLLARLPELRQRRDGWLRNPELQAEVSDWEASVTAAGGVWRTLTPTEFTSSGGATLTRLADDSLLASGVRPDQDTYTIVAATELDRITGLRLELLTDESLPQSGPGRQENGNLHLNEIAVYVAARGDAAERQRLTLANPRADFNQQGWTIEHAVDGNPDSAWGIHPEVGKPHRAVFEVAPGQLSLASSQTSGAPGALPPSRAARGLTVAVELQQTHGRGHLIGRLRLAVTDAPHPLPLDTQTLPPAVAAALSVPAAERGEEQRMELAAHYLEGKLKRELAALPPPALVYCGTNRFTPDGTFRPAAEPRAVHILHRGNISEPRNEALPGALDCLPNLPGQLEIVGPADEGQRRAALARWLSDRDNVLLWRSIANRIWHFHFGKGLVDTPGDFGRMGGVPSHPELLDWLASELRDHGGSLKALHRAIVTSAVYRQASTHQSRFAEIDADNRWLWRMNRQRLDAESIRDGILQISGLLDGAMGGPSVRQFVQTPGVHVTPNVDYLGFDADDPANRRRSVYRFIFRTLPDPFMDALDCPDASQLTPRRNTSLTALQALAMLNDKVTVRHSAHVADRIARGGGTVDEQVLQAFWLIFCRPPTELEADAVANYVAQHGLGNACRFLLNSNEFLFVD